MLTPAGLLRCPTCRCSAERGDAWRLAAQPQRGRGECLPSASITGDLQAEARQEMLLEDFLLQDPFPSPLGPTIPFALRSLRKCTGVVPPCAACI